MFNFKQKTLWIALLGWIFMSNNINAQSVWATVIRAGYNNSNIKLDMVNFPKGETTSKHGFYAGIGSERRFSERASLTMDAEYLDSHSYLKSPNGGIEGKLKTGILGFGLGLKFYPTYDLGIYTGGYIQIPLSPKMTLQDSNKTPQQLETIQKAVNQELKDYTNLDLGLRLGVDYRIVKQLHIEAFYRWGLSNAMKKSNRNNETREMKISSINVGLNYRLGFENR